VRIGNRYLEDIEIERDVRQGCILSSLLFNIYLKSVFEETLGTSFMDIKINMYVCINTCEQLKI
jgi:hypothetical protein